jgi:hypothetical protein
MHKKNYNNYVGKLPENINANGENVNDQIDIF